MKKIILIAVALTMAISASAQTRTETFDSNTMGWTEISDKKTEAVIKDGVMKVTSKKGFRTLLLRRANPSSVETHCYSGLDVKKDFTIECTAKAKKLSKNGWVGMVLDYDDNGNMLLFGFNKKHAVIVHYKDGDRNGAMHANIKHNKKKNAPIKIKIVNDNQKLLFYVNDMKILERRYLELESDGVGFYAEGKQTVWFDEIKFIQ